MPRHLFLARVGHVRAWVPSSEVGFYLVVTLCLCGVQCPYRIEPPPPLLPSCGLRVPASNLNLPAGAVRSAEQGPAPTVCPLHLRLLLFYGFGAVHCRNAKHHHAL